MVLSACPSTIGPWTSFVENKYPITLIVDLFDQLVGVNWFMKLCLHLGYYQVRIVKEDVQKMDWVMRYGSNKFLAILFELTYVSATFCTLMKKVLQPFLDPFDVV